MAQVRHGQGGRDVDHLELADAGAGWDDCVNLPDNLLAAGDVDSSEPVVELVASARAEERGVTPGCAITTAIAA